MKRLLLPLISGIFIAGQVNAFLVKNIKLEGLQRISPGTVYQHFPISANDDVDKKHLASAVKTLFKTGYFSDIQLAHDGDTLIVQLTERSTIGRIDITGNKIITKENLKKVLRQTNMAEGDIYMPATLTAIRQELEKQYVSQGRYTSSVETKVVPQPNNRVFISIKINEGEVAAIQKINIVGAHAFKEKTLLDALQLKTKNWASWIRGDNKYSKEKLAGDIEILRSYYMDHGYVKFQITSTQTSVTPDKKHIYITINIDEGAQYKLGKLTLTGNLIFPEAEIKKLITIKSGETFSRKNITDIADNISSKLGEKGYIFADINPIPDIDEKTKTANITFSVDPGKQVYVRRINFTGNTRTRDEVLRREMRQLEASLANKDDITNSTDHLNRLGFFKNIDLKTTPVSSSSDQVDLNYNLEEQHSGSLMGSLGYSQSEGLLLGASVTENNFLGTGNAVSIAASSSKFERNYEFSYDNPYYTVDGVSRGFDLFYNTTNYKKSETTNYNINRLGADVNFGYPISDISRLSFSLGFTNTSIKEGDNAAYIVKEYLKKHGKKYNTITPKVGWYQSKLNYGIFPTAGHEQTLSLEVGHPGKTSQAFYKLNYVGTYIHPLNDSFSVKFHGHTGYGNTFNSKGLPFYENFFSGGLGSVRGFSYQTLGPQALRKVETTDNNKGKSTSDTYDPIGGNVVADGTIALIFPVPFVKDKRSMQGSLFLDGGNVWSTKCSKDKQNGKPIIINCKRPNLAKLSYSIGIGIDWLTPIGQLSFNLAKPIKKEKTDKKQTFQFNIGKTF